jgi:hypothetical protein
MDRKKGGKTSASVRGNKNSREKKVLFSFGAFRDGKKGKEKGFKPIKREKLKVN